MRTKSLVEWSAANRIIERTERGFENYLENWKNENRGDFFDSFRGKSNLKLITTELHSIQLTYMNEFSEYVYCNLSILYLGQYLGNYKMKFTLEGVVDDDVINFEQDMKQTINEGTIKVEIIKRAISQGYTIDVISKLIGLEENLIQPLFLGSGY
ncbi:hypothetical protein PA598K_07180 [Paenibacillus sp. 598K]|uniref:hypothetical protein n=1 Tax=Paenibacillus sp. 598K TaxID=1117987 RepID=UPI000FFAE783|nr:hypothetical protein [Paenibacillus sp. 598K]GBF78521.1 hypothetical protein PA598K_07180 [Paenibacillus sp. 598K]